MSKHLKVVKKENNSYNRKEMGRFEDKVRLVSNEIDILGFPLFSADCERDYSVSELHMWLEKMMKKFAIMVDLYIYANVQKSLKYAVVFDGKIASLMKFILDEIFRLFKYLDYILLKLFRRRDVMFFSADFQRGDMFGFSRRAFRVIFNDLNDYGVKPEPCFVVKDLLGFSMCSVPHSCDYYTKMQLLFDEGALDAILTPFIEWGKRTMWYLPMQDMCLFSNFFDYTFSTRLHMPVLLPVEKPYVAMDAAQGVPGPACEYRDKLAVRAADTAADASAQAAAADAESIEMGEARTLAWLKRQRVIVVPQSAAVEGESASTFSNASYFI